jgi:uracil-DNA glycosylase
MRPPTEPSWNQTLTTEFEKPYFVTLIQNVETAYQTSVIYPPVHELFAAFTQCPLPTVKVVILGQDPYHGPRQAHGLAFSVPDGVSVPPSLRNIYKEITNDLGIPAPTSGNLIRFAQQGVLLLNSSLSVAAGQPLSHQDWGWEEFTDAIIQAISRERTNVVFLLWGTFAISKRVLINEQKHLVLTAPHPSPLSAHRGFFGCRHFSQTNAYLTEHGQSAIVW